MNCYNIVIITFCLLSFNAAVIGAEIGEKNVGFIQDNRGRKWSVFQDKQNMFAQRENEKVKVAPYIQYKTLKLSNFLYVLYIANNNSNYQIKTDEGLLVSSATSLDF